nr:tetratricopeptide repeat-containing sensor histidine kinase [uncultured Emticicia sp.]
MSQLAAAQDISSLKVSLSSVKVDTTRSRLLYELGMAYERTYPDSSFYFINQSLQLSNSTNNILGMARAMYGLGYINMYYAKNEIKALAWFNKSIAISKKNNIYLYLSKSYLIIGIISENQRIGNSLEIYNKALFFAKKAKNWVAKNDVLSNLSLYFFQLRKFDEAEMYIKLAMEESQNNDLDVWFSNGLDYCNLLLFQKKDAQAIAFAKKMQNEKQKLKKNIGEFVYLNDIGRLETILKNYSEAEKSYLLSLSIEKAKPKVDTFHLYFIYRNLEGLYRQQGDYKKAYQASKDFLEVTLWLKNKTQTQDSKLQLINLRADLEIEKKEVEIALLETKEKQQRALLIAIGIIVVMLFGFMIFLQQNKQKIQIQKEALSELNATKDKLFAILSHDLRSPVAILKNSLMLIEWGALSQSEFAELTNRLNIQLINVSNILDNAINWVISQMEGLKSKVIKVNVCEIIEEKISMFMPTQTAKQITIENQVSPTAQVMFDKNHFQIVISNLLQNALKFTDCGGNIVFNLIKFNNSVIISISDNGVGIAEDKLKTLFELGKTNSTLGTLRESGTGLGLLLVKELIELNDGILSVKSKIGEGTTFYIKCPDLVGV